MQLLLLRLLLSALSTTTIAKAVCSKPPPPDEQLPSAADCNELIKDIFAISKLEDDKKVNWSQEASETAGNRRLPYHFTNPSANNNCEVIVDAWKQDGTDTFAVRDVAIKARGVVKDCLEASESDAKSIGAQVVGDKRQVAVFVVKKVPLPTQAGGSARWWTGSLVQTRWWLPMNATNLFVSLAGSSTS
ncbi:hypothetical protein ACLMJK_001172 [Lecanora helva]